MGLNAAAVLGIIGYVLMIPASGWLTAFMYLYMQPLDKPVDLNRARLFIMAGALAGAMVALIGIHFIVTSTTST